MPPLPLPSSRAASDLPDRLLLTVNLTWPVSHCVMKHHTNVAAGTATRCCFEISRHWRFNLSYAPRFSHVVEKVSLVSVYVQSSRTDMQLLWSPSSLQRRVGSWTSSRSCEQLLSSNRRLIYWRPSPSLCLLGGKTLSALLRSALRSRPCAAPRHLGGVLQKSLTPERLESVVSALVLAGDIPGPFDHCLRRAIQEDQFGVEFLFQLQFPGLTHLEHTRV